MSYITLLAKVIAKPGKEEQTFAELKAMVAPSCAEAGCIKYVLHRLPGEPRTFWFVEEWRSQAALDEHTKMPHYIQMKERTKDLVESAELTLLEPVV
jgi:quinol monooxygenase YgiN